MNLEQAILDRVVPDENEERRLRETIASLIDIVSRAIRRMGLKAEPLLVGSVARGTYLRNPEIDIFVTFPPETSREDLESHGLRLGQFLKKKKKMYAEHPYTRGIHNGFDVEIVPCYAVVSPLQIMSAVDRTPYHTKYVISRLRGDQRDQARLLKAFMKGIGIYGAEARVQGFSGYLCELLILKYGTFRDVLKATLNWQPGNVIALDTLPSRLFDEPLIVVDPVDGGRNVASAVSKDKMATLIHAATEYLRKPRMEFFFPNPPPKISKGKLMAILKKRGTHLTILTMRAPKLTDDILYPQIRKALKAFQELLVRNGFGLLRSDFNVVGKEIVFMFEFETYELPRVKKHEGPPAWVKNAFDFQMKWSHSRNAISEPYIEDGFWMADIKRNQVTATQLVKDRYNELSLGKDLDKSARTSLKVLTDLKALKQAYLGPLFDLLEHRFPWDR